MFSSDEHSDIFTYLVGLIVLVMVAVGLSLVIDKRFKFSNGVSVIQQELKLGDSEIAELTSEYEDLSLQHKTFESKHSDDFQTYHKLSTILETQRQRRADLQQTHCELSSAIALLGQDFSRIRNDYRRRTWTAAIGETLGDLSVRGGHIYRQTTISRVTDVGLEIRHEHGFARIQGPDLDLKLQERFQWDDEERRRSLQTEQRNQDDQSTQSAAGQSIKPLDSNPVNLTNPVRAITARNQKTAIDANSEKLTALRKQIGAWKQKIAILRTDKTEADSQASYGSSNSVPGSLETWEAKASRLGRELAKARISLELAKVQLAQLAPTDFLLQQDEENDGLFR